MRSRGRHLIRAQGIVGCPARVLTEWTGGVGQRVIQRGDKPHRHEYGRQRDDGGRLPAISPEMIRARVVTPSTETIVVRERPGWRSG